jgi:hypothetical protein
MWVTNANADYGFYQASSKEKFNYTLLELPSIDQVTTASWIKRSCR